MLNDTKEKRSRLSRISTRLLKVANYFFDRLAEASTMRAIVVLGSTAAGYTLDQANIEHYIVVGILVAQTIALLIPDKVEIHHKEAKDVDSGPDLDKE